MRHLLFALILLSIFSCTNSKSNSFSSTNADTTETFSIYFDISGQRVYGFIPKISLDTFEVDKEKNKVIFKRDSFYWRPTLFRMVDSLGVQLKSKVTGLDSLETRPVPIPKKEFLIWDFNIDKKMFDSMMTAGNKKQTDSLLNLRLLKPN